jgi:thiosulfate/3-mercaptopyruvate sulfurtransferase
MKKRTALLTWLSTLTVSLLVLSACGESVENATTQYQPLPEWSDERPEEEQSKEPQPFTTTDVFVSASKVKALRDDKDATIIDARPLDAYKEGHIKGAVHAKYGDPEGYKPFKNPEYHDTLHRDVGHLQEVTRELGVFNERPVVVYGTPGSKKAGRLFWTLEYLGHGEVYLYTPGYETLRKELGEDASTKDIDLEGDFVVRRRSSVLATNEDVKAVANGEKDGILIDTRRESEFTGEEVRAPRHGYIPKATFYHWENIFTETDGRREIKPTTELESSLESKGLLKEDAVLIPYCQTGTRSAYVYAALRYLGSENAQNYDGSWARYARLKAAPVSHDGESKLKGE